MQKLNHKLLVEILRYIEAAETLIDREYGSCRTMPQLLKDRDMPEVYYKIIEVLKQQKKTGPAE